MEYKVVAVAPGIGKAREAVEKLIGAGIPPNEISIIYAAPRRAKKVSVRREEIEIIEHPPAEETLADATAGAMLGGIAGLLVGIASVIIPEVGLVYVAGALATAVAGAVIGTAAGGLIGALRDIGLTEDEVRDYLTTLDAGAAVVIIHTTKENREIIEEALSHVGITDVHIIQHETKRIPASAS